MHLRSKISVLRPVCPDPFTLLHFTLQLTFATHWCPFDAQANVRLSALPERSIAALERGDLAERRVNT
jgi:hypothetical protein